MPSRAHKEEKRQERGIDYMKKKKDIKVGTKKTSMKGK